jgi:hypothetical protein
MFRAPSLRAFSTLNTSASCPLNYRITEKDLKSAPKIHGDTFYVVGGLYGNPFALDTIISLKDHEEKLFGKKVTTVDILKIAGSLGIQWGLQLVQH